MKFVIRFSLLCVLGACFCRLTTIAAPVSFYPLTLTQPDGSVLHCFASGDEYYNWLHDKDGYTIMQDPGTGFYVYADRRDGQLVCTKYVPGIADPAALGLEKWAIAPQAELAQHREAMQRQLMKGGPVKAMAPGKGAINNIAIFIRFSDEAEFKDSLQYYDTMFNSLTSSSLHGYYWEVSQNTLTINTTFYPKSPTAVVRSYRDAKPRSYYQPYNATTNLNGYQSAEQGSRLQTLLLDALSATIGDIPKDLVVDSDGDGVVDNICFIASGDPTAWATLLWPHMSSLYSGTITINGARIGTYNFQLQNFLKGSTASVLCHEMFHSIGAPDLYHYSYDGFSPTGSWDLMESNATPPQHMLTYMKYEYGHWLSSVPEITASGYYTLSPTTAPSNTCYKIKSPYSKTEFFVLEFRKKTTLYESAIPGEGLLVYRINTKCNGNAGGPPDEMYIFRPGGTAKVNGTVGQAAFSAGSGRTAINDKTDPYSFLSDGRQGGLNISNIGAVGNTISFYVHVDSQAILITSPDDDSHLAQGSVKKISWKAYGPTKAVKMEWTSNGGATWNTIAPAAKAQYYWNVPSTPAPHCQLRVSDVANPTAFDTCNFAIGEKFYPVQFNYDATTATQYVGNSAATFANGEFWVTRANSKRFTTLTPQGKLKEDFEIYPITKITSMTRGVTVDGEFIYMATGLDVPKQLWPEMKMKTGDIFIIPSFNANYIAFDPNTDNGNGGLWVGNANSDIIQMDLNGAEKGRIKAATHGLSNITGLAYDPYSPGGPFFWAFNQSAGANSVSTLVRLSYPDGRQTNLSHDIADDIGASTFNPSGGGVFVAEGIVPDKKTLGGILTGSPDRLFGYELPDSVSSLLFIENFDYAAGSKLASDGWTELNAGANALVSDMGLFYGRYAGSNIGNALPLRLATNGQNVYHPIAPQKSGSVYASFLVSVDSLMNGTTTALQFAATTPGAARFCNFHVLRTTGNNARFGISKEYPQEMTEYAPLSYPCGSTHLVVVEYSFGENSGNQDSVSLWIDPPFTGIAPVPLAKAGALSQARASEIGSIVLCQQSQLGQGTITIDGIRMATTWSEVMRDAGPAFSRGTLIVDETDEAQAPFAKAGITDSTVDAFYDELFSPAVKWDYKTRGMPSYDVLSQYQLVVWHADHLPALDFHQVAVYENTQNLSNYLDAGGKLLLSGWRLGKSFDWDKNYPIEYTAGELPHDYLNIVKVDESATDGDFTGAKGTPGVVSDIRVDTAKLAAAPFFGMLAQVNVFTNLADSTKILFTYANADTTHYPQFKGLPCGIRCGKPGYDAITLGFPLFFIRKDDAKRLADEVIRNMRVIPVTVRADEAPQAPREFALEQNYPNPFNPSTTIRYALPSRSSVRLTVYDALGRVVAMLVDASQNAGPHAAVWSANAPSGVYFYRIEAAPEDGSRVPFIATRKMVLMK